MTRPWIVVALALAVSGCVTLTPTQEQGAHEVRLMADATARTYGVPRIYVMVGDNIDGVGGSYRHGLFTVTTSMLMSRHRDSIVAHELAHYLLGHDRPLAGRLALDWQREQEQRELDANAKAVEVLVRVRGMSEAQALSLVYDHLLSFNRLVQERRTVLPWGHRPPCDEIADLLERFASHRAWTEGLQCAPGTARLLAAVEPLASVPPARDAAQSGLLVHSYFTDRPPVAGTVLRARDPTSLPRAVQAFDRSRDRDVILFLGVRRAETPRMLVTRWYDRDGVERRTVARALALPPGPANTWTWQTHSVPMWELRPYPGRWTTRVFVDDAEVGVVAFDLEP
jgi:IrrE N-terminal-like domain